MKVFIFYLFAFLPFIPSWADQELYYEVKGTGPAIVFSHDGFGDRRMWDGQYEEFSKKYRVIRYDHRGYGKSPAPTAEYSPVQDLLNLLDQLKIDRAHIVGNSLGGSLGIDFTLQHPSRVASLTVVASGPRGLPVTKEAQEMRDALFKTLADKGLETAAEMLINSPMVAVTSRSASTTSLLKKMIHENSSTLQMQFWPFEKMDPPAVKRLDEIKAPTLIILGEKDMKIVNDGGNIAASGIAGAQKEIIAGADHLPQMVDPKTFNAILLKFLESVEVSKE